MPEDIRLLIVGRKIMFRQCAAAALERRRRFKVIAEVPDLGAALIRTPQMAPDIVVVHLSAPVTAIDLNQLRELSQAGRAVVVISAAQAGEVNQLLQAGVRGYLDDSRELHRLEHAIDQIYVGDDVVVATAPVPDFPHGHPMRSRDDVQAPGPNLTGRELEVLRLVALGRTNGEIARELCITEHTTKGHLGKILGKLGLENRVQLATYAMHNRLVEPVQAPPTAGHYRAHVKPPN